MKTLRVLIAGPRIFQEHLVYSEQKQKNELVSYRHLLFPMFDISLAELYEMFTGYPEPNKKGVTIISGTAKGVDTEGIYFAESRGYSIELYPADWNKYKKSAGFIRNEIMVKRCHAAIIVWDGNSKGTKHALDLLDKHGKPYILWRMHENDHSRQWDESMIKNETLNTLSKERVDVWRNT